MNKEQLFREAIGENSQRIFRICSYYFTDPDDRNDAYQDSLIRIWENLSGFKGNSKVSTWIYRVVVNTCLSFLRKEKRRKHMFDDGKDYEISDSSNPKTLEESLVFDDKLIFFMNFMNRISLADRTLVSLYLEELTTKEMAEITGFTEVNVRVKIHRIKEQIKKEWEEKNYGTG